MTAQNAVMEVIMKVFVTGVCGQLGYDVMNELTKRNYEAIGSDIKETCDYNFTYVSLDITNQEKVNRTINEAKPDVIVHCAAWTAVDAAEDEDKQELVRNINVNGTKYLVEAAKVVSAKFVYISTDYVFDGLGEKPWNPECKDYIPLNVYGKTKLEGELSVVNTLDNYFIVRIAWAFGLNGNNFIKTMLNLSQKYKELRVVDDQIGTPTYTFDLARLLVDMMETDKYGYYHVTNEGGYISWCDFAKEIFKQARVETKVHPITTEEYGVSKAKRPFNSRLDKSKLVKNGFEPLPTWQDALGRYLKEIKK